jgi:hypothetical protein
VSWVGALVAAIAAACSAGNSDGPADSTGDGGGGGLGGGAGGSGGLVGGDGGSLQIGGAGGVGGGPIECDPGGPDDDVDQDDFTPASGDCNDCDPNVNPNAIEVIGQPDEEAFDEDCDTIIDEELEPPCDGGIAIDEQDPMVAAQALELCKVSSGPGDWGLVSAQWVMVDGSPPPAGSQGQNFNLGHGVLDGFGPNVTVQAGQQMLAVSSGSARRPTDPGYQDVGGFDKGYLGAHPQGFPKESPACPGTFTGQPHDTTALEVVVRTPSNAYGITFDFNFYTYEWPGFVCSTYNDFFVAILSPIPDGQTDGNISFDSQGNPVSVNNAFLDVCGCPGNPPAACFAGGKQFTCPLGNVELIGTGFGFDTGFEDHAATSWLQTQAPVEPGTEITMRWGAYDSGDGALDSTGLVDNWQWIAEPGQTVGTTPVPK